MGAWGTGALENDTACDWSGDLVDREDLAFLRETLRAAHEVDDDELDVDLGCAALAACEVVARLQGRFGRKDVFTSDLDQWVRARARNATPELVQLATRVIDRVAARESVLARQWQGDQRWHASVQDLRKRVAG